MALSQRSKHALARLRTYNPPPTQWYNCPLTRRAAVLILLFPDRHGELKVVLTMRSASLNTYAGQAALPGGKSDSLDETPFQTARREAYEEIGLPLDETKLRGFRVEEMCELPTNLAKTELGVRPCVAFLAPKEKDGENEGEGDDGVSVEERLIPRLDPKEVAAVFTAPFHAFLSKNLPEGMPQPYQKNGRAEKWYRGSWTDWHESRWRMHNFYIPRPPRSTTSTTSSATSSKPPTTSTRVTRSTSHLLQNPALAATGAQPTPHHALPNGDDPRPEPNALDEMTTFRVFGMTARILVDAARVAYGEEPEFEHNSHHGDEEMIARLLKMGRLSEKRERGEVLTKEVLKAASKM